MKASKANTTEALIKMYHNFVMLCKQFFDTINLNQTYICAT